MIKEFLHLIRWEEWYDSKLPLVAATVYHLAMRYPESWPDAVIRYSLALIFCALFLSYGYAVNDYSDIEVDKRAGKKKAVAEIPRLKTLVFLTALALLGIASLIPYYRDRQVFFAVVLCYALGTAYSLPPARLKERGVVGLLGSAIAQRSLPVLAIGAVWRSMDMATLGWALLGFLIGMRYILIHQRQDLEADLQSHVITFAAKRPAMITQLTYVTLVLEVIVTSLLVLLIALSNPLFWVVPPGYIAYSIWYYSLHEEFIGLPDLTSFAHVPLADLYMIFLPIALLVLLIGKDIKWLLLLPLELVWKKRCAQQYLSLPYRHVVGLWQRRAGSLRRRE